MNQIIKIKNINLRLLNNNEYSQFIKGIESLIEIATIEKLAIQEPLFTSFKEHITLMIDATNQSTGRHETKKLHELDKRRDELSTYLLSVFRTETKSSLTNKKEAGTILYGQMKKYLGLTKQPYRQKTNIIDSMVGDLLKTENTKYVKALGVSEVVADLKSINQQYSKLTEERAENQVKTKLPSVKSLRKITETEYDLMMQWAFAASLITPSDETQNFVTMTNKLIDDTVSLRKQRIGLLKKTKTEISSE